MPEDGQRARTHEGLGARSLLGSTGLLPFPAPSKEAVRAVQAMNRICVLDVDLQGVRSIKKTDLHPIYISVQPPSMDVLVGTWCGKPAGQA